MLTQLQPSAHCQRNRISGNFHIYIASFTNNYCCKNVHSPSKSSLLYPLITFLPINLQIRCFLNGVLSTVSAHNTDTPLCSPAPSLNKYTDRKDISGTTPNGSFCFWCSLTLWTLKRDIRWYKRNEDWNENKNSKSCHNVNEICFKGMSYFRWIVSNPSTQLIILLNITYLENQDNFESA